VADGTIAVRPFETQDLDGVLELLRLSLGETAVLARSPELFAWKHLQNPFGRSILLVAEGADAAVIGFRAFMRWRLSAPGGVELSCVRAVDTATHPDFQRRGIFRRLTPEGLDAARGEGVDLVFNTPNPKSRAGYLTMGWGDVGPIGVLAAPARGIMRGRVGAGIVPEPADFVRDSKPVGTLHVDDRPARGLRTPRTPEYLAWRYNGHPTARYAQVEDRDSFALVRPTYRSGRRELSISDVFGGHPARAIRRCHLVSRATYLAAWFSKGSPERRSLVLSGLVPVPRVSILNLVAHPLRNDLPVDVMTPSSWDLALGDLELL